MRTATKSLLFVAGLVLLAACGSVDDQSTEAGDDRSAITVAGAESGIVEEGDSRPDDEADPASVVSITVDLPEGADIAGTAIVALEDITYADAAAVEIASVNLPVAQLVEQQNQVDIFLPLPLDGSVEVTATVHIDVDESGSISQGDWISPALAPVTGAGDSVTVTMIQV